MKQTQRSNDIPHFGLYGESSVSQDPGFVHIEDIGARSEEIGWLIKPHRHDNLFQILCIFDGALDVQLDEETHTLSGVWAVTIPPGVVHGIRIKPDAKGIVLSLAAPLLADEGYRQTRHYFDELVSSAQTIEFQRRSVLLEQLRHYLNLIVGEFQQAETGHELMLEWLVRMVLMTLKRQFDHKQFQALSSRPSSNMLTEFRSLLENKYRKQWRVQQYAAALHTSVSSLNRLCNECVGITAKSIIQNRVLLEAKRKLIYTQYPHIARPTTTRR
jgi:AraC family transcriptional activator of pobA